MKPYYEHGGITIFHGESMDIVPTLGRFDLLLTDPPYGIKRDKGMGGGGYDGFGGRRKRTPKEYVGGWDEERPSGELLSLCVRASDVAIVWGGNYFADLLPVMPKWLVWDKEQTMPSFSDAELAWTTIPGQSVKMFRYCGAGLRAVEKERDHPTQKPMALMSWCMGLVPDAVRILDPFGGSGTTARVCKDFGKECVTIEREERYCEIAARLEQEVLAL